MDRLFLLFALIVCGWSWIKYVESVPPEKSENTENFEIEKAPLFESSVTDTAPPLVGSQVYQEVTIRLNGEKYKRIFYPDGSKDIKIEE